MEVHISSRLHTQHQVRTLFLDTNCAMDSKGVLVSSTLTTNTNMIIVGCETSPRTLKTPTLSRTPWIMDKLTSFDGNLDPVKHFPPTFLTKDLARHIAILRDRVTDQRKSANAALAKYGPIDPHYHTISYKADIYDTNLDAATEHLNNFTKLAPLYREICRKFAQAHEGTWTHFKSRKNFVLSITERDVTNKELEEIVDDFKGYEKDLARIRHLFKSELRVLKEKWDGIVAMGTADMGEEVGKAVEELACKAGAMFRKPSDHTLLLIDRLHAFDPLFAEGILWHVLDRFPQAARLSRLEEYIHFRRTDGDDTEA
jgi:hypothetical protein